MKLSAMGAIELHSEIERSSGATLGEALDEIHRLRTICQDIIEVIGVEYAQGAEADFCLEKIDDIAHRYFKP